MVERKGGSEVSGESDGSDGSDKSDGSDRSDKSGVRPRAGRDAAGAAANEPPRRSPQTNIGISDYYSRY